MSRKAEGNAITDESSADGMKKLLGVIVEDEEVLNPIRHRI